MVNRPIKISRIENAVKDNRFTLRIYEFLDAIVDFIFSMDTSLSSLQTQVDNFPTSSGTDYQDQIDALVAEDILINDSLDNLVLVDTDLQSQINALDAVDVNLQNQIDNISGGVNSGIAVVDFGASFTDKASFVVTGETWVTSTAKITAQVLTASGTDTDEMYLLDFKVNISDIVDGVGFTITLYSQPEATGTYSVMFLGA